MKTAVIPFGENDVIFDVPDSVNILASQQLIQLKNPAEKICKALEHPIASRPLSEIAKGRKNAAIVVSDNTRPVPYKEPDGILMPIVNCLRQNGISQIKVIVANGTHRPLSEAELEDMLGKDVFRSGIKIINHIASDDSMLRYIGSTRLISDIRVNKHYLDADLKIITGLVEPHFMAGFSGGRKAICPGICGQSVTNDFHSALILEDLNTASLVLQDNPCHEQSLQIAKMAGVDFLVNVIIDIEKKLTGVFAGNLEHAHQAAINCCQAGCEIKINRLYDLVITHAGHVGVNHYQCAKAAIEASKAVKSGGVIVLAANLTDPDPIGSENYKYLLKLLTNDGAENFRKRILSEDWKFIYEQWQLQMWTKVFMRLGNEKNLYMLAPRLSGYPQYVFPETNVFYGCEITQNGKDAEHVSKVIKQIISNKPNCDILILPDGPYGVPIFNKNIG